MTDTTDQKPRLHPDTKSTSLEPSLPDPSSTDWEVARTLHALSRFGGLPDARADQVRLATWSHAPTETLIKPRGLLQGRVVLTLEHRPLWTELIAGNRRPPKVAVFSAHGEPVRLYQLRTSQPERAAPPVQARWDRISRFQEVSWEQTDVFAPQALGLTLLQDDLTPLTETLVRTTTPPAAPDGRTPRRRPVMHPLMQSLLITVLALTAFAAPIAGAALLVRTHLVQEPDTAFIVITGCLSILLLFGVAALDSALTAWRDEAQQGPPFLPGSVSPAALRDIRTVTRKLSELPRGLTWPNDPPVRSGLTPAASPTLPVPTPPSVEGPPPAFPTAELRRAETLLLRITDCPLPGAAALGHDVRGLIVSRRRVLQPDDTLDTLLADQLGQTEAAFTRLLGEEQARQRTQALDELRNPQRHGF